MYHHIMRLIIIPLAIITVMFCLSCKHHFTTQPTIVLSQKSSRASLPASSQPQSYVACGCGCCNGVEPQRRCLSRSKGEDIQKIIEEDKKAAQSPSCRYVGCSRPILYLYCD